MRQDHMVAIQQQHQQTEVRLPVLRLPVFPSCVLRLQSCVFSLASCVCAAGTVLRCVLYPRRRAVVWPTQCGPALSLATSRPRDLAPVPRRVKPLSHPPRPNVLVCASRQALKERFVRAKQEVARLQRVLQNAASVSYQQRLAASNRRRLLRCWPAWKAMWERGRRRERMGRMLRQRYLRKLQACEATPRAASPPPPPPPPPRPCCLP